MEDQPSQLAVTHLLQHSLRSLCIHENSQWVYAVFWRILPRNYPPPKWDSQAAAYDRSRGNRRNWILVWEDGFYNVGASAGEVDYGNQQYQGLKPELFFKMSHEIYNYGEGLIGKVAADRSHKWIFKEPNDQEINFLCAWNNSADSHPRAWEAQFQSGIKTIALIAVREGVIQLGSIHKVIEDLSYVVLLRKKFNYIESIPGVLLPHPSSSSAAAASYPFNVEEYNTPEAWQYFQGNLAPPPTEFCHHYNQPINITPSMSSLEALLSKLPSVVPPVAAYCEAQPPYISANKPMELMGMEKAAKEEVEEEKDGSSMSSFHPSYEHFSYHHDLNVSSSMPNNGY